MELIILNLRNTIAHAECFEVGCATSSMRGVEERVGEI